MSREAGGARAAMHNNDGHSPRVSILAVRHRVYVGHLQRATSEWVASCMQPSDCGSLVSCCAFGVVARLDRSCCTLS